MRTVAMSGPVAAELFWIFESDIRRLVGAAKYSAGGSTPRTIIREDRAALIKTVALLLILTHLIGAGKVLC
jgi:hypothetical protein